MFGGRAASRIGPVLHLPGQVQALLALLLTATLHCGVGVGVEFGFDFGAAMEIMVAVAALLTLCTLAVYVNAQNNTFPVPSYYVLGDGYFDAGNNNYIRNDVPHANFKPYGMTYFHYPTGRFCDGRVFPDLLGG